MRAYKHYLFSSPCTNILCNRARIHYVQIQYWIYPTFVTKDIEFCRTKLLSSTFFLLWLIYDMKENRLNMAGLSINVSRWCKVLWTGSV